MDLIDQLWSYIISTIKMAIIDGEAMTFFPDQPIKITIKDRKESMLFQIQIGNEISSHVFPKGEFIKEILSAAKFFFQQMIDYDKELLRIYKTQLDEIENVKKLFNV